jgi:hypothetical protein
MNKELRKTYQLVIKETLEDLNNLVDYYLSVRCEIGVVSTQKVIAEIVADLNLYQDQSA